VDGLSKTRRSGRRCVRSLEADWIPKLGCQLAESMIHMASAIDCPAELLDTLLDVLL